jgi:hypothetical protein
MLVVGRVEQSAAAAIAVPPAATISLAIRSSVSPLPATSMTLAPRAAACLAVTSPILELAR